MDGVQPSAFHPVSDPFGGVAEFQQLPASDDSMLPLN
jgi:hypothetical protein